MTGPEIAGDSRNEKGQFVPGVSGNPAGKPPGTISIVAKIKKKFEDNPDYFEQWINKLLEDAGTGRALKEAMAMMHISDGLQREAIEALRLLRTVQRKANRQFSVVRNKAIAHRDPDALAQYRAIRDLKVGEVMEIAVEFFRAVGIFVDVQTRLFNESNTLEAYLTQWAASEKGAKKV